MKNACHSAWYIESIQEMVAISIKLGGELRPDFEGPGSLSKELNFVLKTVVGQRRLLSRNTI